MPPQCDMPPPAPRAWEREAARLRLEREVRILHDRDVARQARARKLPPPTVADEIFDALRRLGEHIRWGRSLLETSTTDGIVAGVLLERFQIADKQSLADAELAIDQLARLDVSRNSPEAQPQIRA